MTLFQAIFVKHYFLGKKCFGDILVNFFKKNLHLYIRTFGHTDGGWKAQLAERLFPSVL